MELRMFRSFAELLNYLDMLINNTRKRLAELERYFAMVKEHADRLRNVEELFAKALGVKLEPMNVIDLKGLQVIIGARPTDEAKVLAEVISSMRERLEVLTKIRSLIEPLAQNIGEVPGMVIIVQTANDIPVRLLLKEVRGVERPSAPSPSQRKES